MAAAGTDRAEAVLRFLQDREAAMLAVLEEIVNIDSPSRHREGINAVGDRLAAFLAEFGLVPEITSSDEHGDALRFATPHEGGGAHVLLLGHRDTVWPLGETARRPFKVEGGRAYGPGVADMQGGLVVNAFVLAALATCGAPAPVVALYTCDEEIASPWCRPIIEQAAKGARAVFNSEPGRPSGNVVTVRKGGLFMHLAIEGKAAHSGSAYTEGISAIEELAQKTSALHRITDLDRAITANVGVVGGGATLNTVAPSAFAEMDLRYPNLGDRDGLLAKVEDVVGRSFVPGTRSELTIMGEFRPLEETPASRALFALYRDAAQSVDLSVEAETSGGCADSGATAATGAPTLCGTGPVGGGAHALSEYIEVPTLLKRAQAMALSIVRLDELG